MTAGRPLQGQGSTPALWSDVLIEEQPELTISYRAALTTYEESFIRGQFVARGWNGSGFLNSKDGRLIPGEFHAPQSF
jgi:hypothetical protein